MLRQSQWEAGAWRRLELGPLSESPVLNTEPEALQATPLDALHRRLGARMVAFAGYALPVQYPLGVLNEHRHTRTAAGLFDVSHMGQIVLHGDEAASALETLVPGDMTGLKPGRQRYTLLMNEAGGILDDLMVANHGDRLVIVANASRKLADAEHLAAYLPSGVKVAVLDDQALLALQGPAAAAVLGRLAPEAASLPFMGVVTVQVGGAPVTVSRSGYTGEDGFEMSLPAEAAEALATRLLAEPEVQPVGLGARDSLRLEAGLCLYGADIDELTTPVEANLLWCIARRRREAGGFPGAAAVQDQIRRGPTRLRVGLRPDGAAPSRAPTPVVAADGTAAGSVTSGGFSPTLGAPIAMGYVRRDQAEEGNAVFLNIRGKPAPARIVPMPFVPHRYVR